MTRDTIKLGSRIVFASKPCEPVGSPGVVMSVQEGQEGEKERRER